MFDCGFEEQLDRPVGPDLTRMRDQLTITIVMVAFNEAAPYLIRKDTGPCWAVRLGTLVRVLQRGIADAEGQN